MSELGKPILKKSDKKTENQCQNAAREKKPLERYVILILKKTRYRMSCELIGKNYLEENPIQKIEKTVKIRVKLPHVNKKLLPRNRFFVQTPFSHSDFKIRAKKNSHRKTTRFFALFPVPA